MELRTIAVPNLYTIWAPGHGRVHGVLGTRQEVQLRLRDRKANGDAFKRERLSPVRLLLRWDGFRVHATDVNAVSR